MEVVVRAPAAAAVMDQAPVAEAAEAGLAAHLVAVALVVGWAAKKAAAMGSLTLVRLWMAAAAMVANAVLGSAPSSPRLS